MCDAVFSWEGRIKRAQTTNRQIEATVTCKTLLNIVLASSRSYKTGRCSAKFITSRDSRRTLRPSPLPWLQVLCDTEAPSLRGKVAAAADKLLAEVAENHHWSLHDDIFRPPQMTLKSGKPLWSDIQPLTTGNNNGADPLLSTAILLTTPLLVFRRTTLLPRAQWCTLNRLHTGQRHCTSCVKKWGPWSSEACTCGDVAMMSHIKDFCAINKQHSPSPLC